MSWASVLYEGTYDTHPTIRGQTYGEHRVSGERRRKMGLCLEVYQ